MAEKERSACGDNGAAKINGFPHIPKPFLIGVGGGTACGKSTVCAKIVDHLKQNGVNQAKRQVGVMSMESFYRELSDSDLEMATKGQFNLDHPSAFDEDLLLSTLLDIKNGKTVKIPQYDPRSYKRKAESQTIEAVDVLILEGILVFYFKEIRDMFNMKLFVDTDPDTRLSRRVMRDMKEMGRDLDQILYQYTTYVKPAFEDFCLPTKKYADVIIPRGADNIVAIDLITQHIQELLKPSKNGRPHRARHDSDSLMVFRGGSRPH